MTHLLAILELAKIRITFFVMLTTTFGYLCYDGKFDFHAVSASFGIFLLACGSAALNHIQEYKLDSLMNRTKNRPLPSGRIRLPEAIAFSLFWSVAGFAILYFTINYVAAILGILALIVYNLIYTPMKRINSMAIFPGSLIGAIPPMVGWVAAGGNVFDFQSLSLAFFFFIWQIPHFWLLLLLFGSDYKSAGFPTLLGLFSKEQLSRITFVWIVATIAMGLLLPVFILSEVPLTIFIIVAVACWLMFDSFKLLAAKEEEKKYSFAFRHINFFVLAVVISISIDKLK